MRTREQVACVVRLVIGSHHANTLRLKRKVDTTDVVTRDGCMDAVAMEHANDHLGFDTRANNGDHGAHRLMIHHLPREASTNADSRTPYHAPCIGTSVRQPDTAHSYGTTGDRGAVRRSPRSIVVIDWMSRGRRWLPVGSASRAGR